MGLDVIGIQSNHVVVQAGKARLRNNAKRLKNKEKIMRYEIYTTAKVNVDYYLMQASVRFAVETFDGFFRVYSHTERSDGETEKILERTRSTKIAAIADANRYYHELVREHT